MPYVLARLRNVKFDLIESVLKADAPQHAKEGLFLNHLWQNADDSNEVLFLFQTDGLEQARRFIDRVHGEALKQDPHANLPKMTFLK